MLAYLGAVAAVGAATIGTLAIYEWIEPSVSLLFFPAVLVPAMYGGYGPGLLATVLSTIVLAYVFVPPRFSFDLGIDDLVRLAVFSAVAFATASLSSRRRRAEEAQRKSLHDLQAAIDTLRKVSGWPVLTAADTGASVRRMLGHAANVVGAATAVAAWESEEEPWFYVASSLPANGAVVTRYPVQGDEAGEGLHPDLADRLGSAPRVSVSFRTEHLMGRVFFTDVDPAADDLKPIVEVVAREVGNSLDQLYLTDRLREIAVREDRIQLARNLHDGVLQALTGVRLELQAIASEPAGESSLQDRLLAIERALAIEQRELRLFIDGLKPPSKAPVGAEGLAPRLDEMSARLAVEWKVPIVVRVTPIDLALSSPTEQGVRLMVHEAVVNALKHAHPSKVTVDVAMHDGILALVVRDDGRGFPERGHLDHDDLVRRNVGPASLRDRVTAMGGRLAIDSTASGSRIEITLPSNQTSLSRA
jgi:signal transduction histidine kinase